MSSKSEGNLKVKGGGGGGVVSGFSLDADCSCKKRAKNGTTWISGALTAFVDIAIFPLENLSGLKLRVVNF